MTAPLPAGAALCALYPTSYSLEDLVEPFRTGVNDFLVELVHDHGCTVTIKATRRPKGRAQLMHWAWRVAKGLTAPSAVPLAQMPFPVAWTVAGAEEMVREYDLAVEPALDSRHIDGRAIDMTITGWKGELEDLYALGARHGVKKLRRDPPHWSDDGS